MQHKRLREEAHTRERALAEANRRMHEFFEIASHDLRTPLTSIMANRQLSAQFRTAGWGQ